MTHLIVLTGAPAPSTLDWDEAVSNRLNVDKAEKVETRTSPESSNSYSAQWRQVPMVNERSEDRAEQIVNSMLSCYPGQAIFVNTAILTPFSEWQQIGTFTSTNLSTASMHTAAETLDDFYNQSLAIHEDLATSELSEFENQSPSASTWSTQQTQVAPSCHAERASTALPFQISPEHLNDVRDIPSAAYLRSIEPQTMTVNLIVGIMALPPSRKVTVGRRWGKERDMELLELLVGDDTRAGFAITIWLANDVRSDQEPGYRDGLAQQMRRLRRRDIILLRNVALCAYQGKVHGQSLRKDVTKVDLLHRQKIDASDVGGLYSAEAMLKPGGKDPVLKKAMRVKQWLTDFVGNDLPCAGEGASTTRQLPPDTQ
jgi:hypothetical protein